MAMDYILTGMEGYHPVDKKTDYAFYYLIQQAALLGLKDIGCLSEMQHRSAENALLQQYREIMKRSSTGDLHID